MSKKKTQSTGKLCTYCGRPAKPVTWDDPFPKTLWVGMSSDRVPKVPSCKPCNNHSNESLLKHFFIAFDSRLCPGTISHFKKPAGKKDFRTFRKMWAEVDGSLYLCLGEEVTNKFVKMFMGIRWILMRETWFFLPADRFILFKLEKCEDYYETRMLPLKVGIANPSKALALPHLVEALNEPMQYKFRDFSYEWFEDDEEGMVMGLRYEREEFAELGNRLYLLCFVPKSLSVAEKS